MIPGNLIVLFILMNVIVIILLVLYYYLERADIKENLAADAPEQKEPIAADVIIDQKVEGLCIKYITINIDKIQIRRIFNKNRPTFRKMTRKENYFLSHGEFEERIVINRYNVLEDGYTTYLLALKYNIKTIKVIKYMMY